MPVHGELVSEEREGPQKGPRVLICDDEPRIIRALTIILREAGFRPLNAGTVVEALAVAVGEHPDAAILDLMLSAAGDEHDKGHRAAGGRRRLQAAQPG